MRPELRSFIVPFDNIFIPNRCGWGNGYVAIPKWHPYYGTDYDTADDEIIAFTDFYVHGGLTLGCHLSKLSKKHLQCYLDQNEGASEEDDVRVFGFDTVHAGDNKKEWPEQKVADHTAELKEALIKCWDAPPPPNRDQFNDTKKYYLENVKSSCKSWLYYQLMDWLEEHKLSELLTEEYLAKFDDLYKLYVQHCDALGIEPESRDEMLDGKDMNDVLEQFNYVYSYTRFDPDYIAQS